METLLAVGGWLWGAVLVLAIAMVAGSRAIGPRPKRGALAAVLGVVVVVYLAVFGVLPALALAGLVPGTRGRSLCDESPGSGCSACIASAHDSWVSDAPCHERPPTALAVTLGGLGPLSRERALTAGAEHHRRLLAAAGVLPVAERAR